MVLFAGGLSHKADFEQHEMHFVGLKIEQAEVLGRPPTTHLRKHSNNYNNRPKNQSKSVHPNKVFDQTNLHCYLRHFFSESLDSIFLPSLELAHFGIKNH